MDVPISLPGRRIDFCRRHGFLRCSEKLWAWWFSWLAGDDFEFMQFENLRNRDIMLLIVQYSVVGVSIITSGKCLFENIEKSCLLRKNVYRRRKVFLYFRVDISFILQHQNFMLIKKLDVKYWFWFIIFRIVPVAAINDNLFENCFSGWILSIISAYRRLQKLFF